QSGLRGVGPDRDPARTMSDYPIAASGAARPPRNDARGDHARPATRDPRPLKNKPPQIIIADDRGERRADLGAIVDDALLGVFGKIEQELFHEGGHDGVEAA